MVCTTPCNCAKCTLSIQLDFATQKSGLQEVYDRHNEEFGTRHGFRLLPKYHPELNPIERVWGRMKMHLRKFSTGKADDLAKNMNEGLSSEGNLPISLIRKYVRLCKAYIAGYKTGMSARG